MINWLEALKFRLRAFREVRSKDECIFHCLNVCPKLVNTPRRLPWGQHMLCRPSLKLFSVFRPIPPSIHDNCTTHWSGHKETQNIE
jgi:hypothetical protein